MILFQKDSLMGRYYNKNSLNTESVRDAGRKVS